MPNIDFILPHWLYWSGLLIFPLVAMGLTRWQAASYQAGEGVKGGRKRGEFSLTIAYIILLVAGFLGLHRLYLKNKWGMVYWPLFALILYSSSMERDIRVLVSDTKAHLEAVIGSQARDAGRIERSQEKIQSFNQRLLDLNEDEASARKRLQRSLDKETKKIDGLNEKITANQALEATLQPQLEEAMKREQQWSSFAFYGFVVTLLLLIFDVFRLPALKRTAACLLAQAEEKEEFTVEAPPIEENTPPIIENWISVKLNHISRFSGEFVAFWSLIAVFVYYYEVIVRYLFNSPTNWAHESMFLMFGMQYLVAGSYAMLTESHVRVDIFYARLSSKGKAWSNLITSCLFFIFAGTLLVTGFIFAMDSMSATRWEVSFTEWAIQYWPVKSVIFIGAALLLLQGISKILQDLTLVMQPNIVGEKT